MPEEQQIPYPPHADSFELYFYMGENRTLEEVAKLRFQVDHPDVAPGSLEWSKKFPSFFTKIRRWAAKEHWTAWVSRKEEQERTAREQEMREQTKGLVEMMKLYRRMARYALSNFAADVKSGTAKIRNLTEAKRIIELDVYLTDVIKSTPTQLPGLMGRMLDETDKKQLDSVFEFLHKRALREIDVEEKESLVKGSSGKILDVGEEEETVDIDV